MSKWLWLLFVVLVIGGMVLASFSSEHPEWEQAKRWVAERRVAWQEDGCSVPYGEPNDGCSRADYREAALAASLLSSAQDQRILALVDSRALPEDALLRATSSAVALLRKGAHRVVDVVEDGRRLGEHLQSSMVDVHALSLAFQSLRLHARYLAEENPAEAVTMLVDGLAAATDVASAGIGVERVIGQYVLEGLITEVDDELLRRCDDEVLRRLSCNLTVARDALPAADDFLERELAHKIVYFDEVEFAAAADVHPAGLWAAWRHGFSMRSYAIATVCEQLDLLQRSRQLADPHASSWASRKVALHWLKDQLGRMPHDFLGMPSVTGIEYSSRRTLAALGQLQQDIAFHRRVTVPRVVDPLGKGAMQVEVHGDDAVFRSMEKEVTRQAKRAPR